MGCDGAAVSSLALGLVCALLAATCYGGGPLLQALAARRTETGTGLGIGLLAKLARNKLFLAGVATDLSGFVFEALALSLAPAAFVTPLLLFDMVVLALLAVRVVNERITRQGVIGIAIILTGGVLLTVAFSTSHHGVGREAHVAEQLGLAVLVALTALAAFFAGRLRGVGVSTAIMAGAAGVSYAVATLCTRQISVSLRHHSVLHQLLTPAPYLLAVAALLSLSLLSRALQAGAAVVAVPVTSAFAALLPAAAGLAIFGEPVPKGWGLAAFLLALPLLLGGLIMLARQRGVSNVLASEHLPTQDAGHPVAAGHRSPARSG
jgi:drug/metabolite transporter (DMT)-like permease